MQQTCRFYALWFLLSVVLVGLLWRLIDLNILNRFFLLRQSKMRIFRIVNIPAYRGMITDRLGVPLAISTPVYSVWISPKLFKATPIQLKVLTHLLHLPISFIEKIEKKYSDRQFVYLKRGNPLFIAQKIRMLKISGVFFQREYRRYYPEGEISSHVVGFTNIDDQGQEGLELAYNQWLGGVSGKMEVLKDRLGYVIADVAVLKKPIQGHDLNLSIDHRIQYLAYHALKATVANYHAKSGSVVVLDVKTREILAMVNQPSYNPNSRTNDHYSCYRNRAVTDMFEPGSVNKPFTIALALESGRYKSDTQIDTNPGWMKIGGYRIHDDLNYGVVTLTQLLQKSSNIAAAKILLSLTPQYYYALIHDFGFGQRTSSGFPGESSGALIPYETWVPSVVATLAYGYGLAVTTLQLAQGYAVLADGGIKKSVTFIKVNQSPQKGVRVLPTIVARTVIKMLETVVQKGGTGTRAQVYGYRIAGKTGTAYIAGPNGYFKHHYVSSFVGIAPANEPCLVVAVIIRDPKGQHFGGIVAAPLFSKIMSDALRVLGVCPPRS